MGQRVAVDARVVDAEGEHPLTARSPSTAVAGSSALRTSVVAGVECGDHGAPAGQQRLEFAVAVELVAEQVHQHDDAGVDLVGDGGQGGLVDLEQADVGRPSDRSRDASSSAAVTPVSRLAPAELATTADALGIEHRAHQAGGGGLAVGGRDGHCAPGQARRELFGGPRPHPQQHHAGQARAAASAGASRQPAGPDGDELSDPTHRDRLGPTDAHIVRASCRWFPWRHRRQRRRRPGTVVQWCDSSNRATGPSARCAPRSSSSGPANGVAAR